MIELRPLSVSGARRLMPTLHRRRPRIVGALFATSVYAGAELVGIACASEPKAPRSRGRAIVEISRVATNGARNGCSKLYGALCRAAASLGYVRAVTFTDPDESGVSLRAAGFRDDGLTREQHWDRPSSRARGKKRSAELSQVRRWVRELQEPRAARARARTAQREAA